MKTFLLLAALLCSNFAGASVITQNTSENSGTLTESFGETFTTPSGGPWNNITFNFFSDIPAVTPAAAGTAFLFSQVFTGTPSSLSSAAPGFIASSTGISGGAYVFDPSVQLAANTIYWIFENGVLTVSGGNAVGGDIAYFAPTPSTNFDVAIGPAQATNFAVNGTVVSTAATPESSSIVLLLLGTIGICAVAGVNSKVSSGKRPHSFPSRVSGLLTGAAPPTPFNL